MLFNPVENLSGMQDLRVIAGDGPVSQALCDPATFAPGGPVFDARVRSLLRLVWPATPAQARLMWGARITAGPDFVPSVLATITGVPGAVLEAATRPDDTAPPLDRLHTAVTALVHDRGPARPETLLDELLFWRGLGHECVPLDTIAALVTALTAAMWDATTTLLTRPGAPDDGPGVIGWLRTTTQAVVLDGELIPAGERCLLLVDAQEPGERPAREPLRMLRWLAPENPSGAGATFARLVAERLSDPSAGAPIVPAQPAGGPRRLPVFLPIAAEPAEHRHPVPRPRTGSRR
ncbi:hypothetical protein [Dactylosporangium sp. CA-233914]|uniref:hypothetical protein n=1 Tax=Dactylosporangium sp. CA-233914 TaxID=3239934 RepID=UPI003D8DFC8B